MVKQFQVGKRYRWDGTANDTREYLCLAVFESRGRHLGVLEHQSDVSDYYAFTTVPEKYSIIPPKPRTGTGYIIDSSTGKRFFTKNKPFINKWGEGTTFFEVEWKEIIPDDQNSEG